MAGAGDLAGALGGAIGQLPTDELHQAAAWLDETGRPTLAEVADGSSSDELAQAVALFDQAHEAIDDALALCENTRQHVLDYLTELGLARYGDSPPSLPHPSTTPRVPTDSAGDRSWVDRVRERLPRYEGGQTTGLIYDQDGNEIHSASGREEVSERARLILHNSDVFPPADTRGAPGVVLHVETKYAQRMKETGQTYGVIVLNNRMCPGDFNCEAAVRAILPRGSVLVVWQPGRDAPIEIHGEARP